VRCAKCQSSVPDASRFCPACGQAVTPSEAATSLGDDATRLSGGAASRPISGSGWLSASGSIDHGRFTPGTVLDDRYRIVGLLGRGGMGEVYRADDLRLGQPVALKCLPPALARDPVRLAQFHNEVRTARQVSHPNVCRVHDIGEIDGQLFLTMEYVDGEDLAASLRRVGRFPEERAIEIARQICAGLAAAHERGVRHRDLKPANIMLDKEGRVRLMDFGLAAIGEVEDIRAGTPAYMAPEQLQGQEVTARSDIYALGLVLYELFTGRRAFDAKTLADLVIQHELGTVTAPTTLVATLDPAIERAILRCLNRDPARRPATAIAVSAALPGGDPLAAALAAGDTPSPEMVAAAGGEASTLSLPIGVALTAMCLVLLVAAAAMADRVILLARTPFDRAPASLFDRARDLERQFGYTEPVADRASGFFTRGDVQAWLRAARSPADQARMLASGAPAVVLFWYRSSPQLLVPQGNGVGPADPPTATTGMTSIVLDTQGHLVSFLHLPSSSLTRLEAGVDWTAVLASASFDAGRFSPAAPRGTPRVYADERLAWTGTLAAEPDVPLRIDAGAYLGRPVFFAISGPWTPAPGPTPPPAPAGPSIVALLATVVVVPGMMLAAAIAARANVRRGRGDRRGALRLGTAVFVVSLGGWLFAAHHLLDATLEQERFFRAVALDLFDAAVIWLFYLAAEPHVRRIWPHILITWSRLLGGSFRDAMVGRDLVIGATCGVAMTVVSYLFHLLPGWMGWPSFEPHSPGFDTLGGTRYVIATGLFTLSNAMLGVMGLALLRLVLRRVWLVFAVATAIFTPLAARGQFQSGILALDLVFGALLVAMILGLLFRYGLFAGFVGFFAHFWTWGLSITLDPNRQYFQTGLMAMGVGAALAVVGFALTRSPRSLVRLSSSGADIPR